MLSTQSNTSQLIQAVERRKQLVRYINDYGGIYSKDLDRSCSHLVLAKSSTESKGSEKVKWALKELQDRDIARRRGKKVEGDDIKIVYEEWIWDCVAYNGRWKEADYDARKPKKQGRVTASELRSYTSRGFAQPADGFQMMS